MDDVIMGKLERGWLSDLFKREDSHFTPWLARETNIAELAKALGLATLGDVEIEVPVGDFRLDILAQDPQTGTIVAVENQFWTGDHKHLGQLLTYAAGISDRTSERKVFVWIAETLKEEHRSALDWLNRITEPGFDFFGIELELWRIGDSPFAPRFSIVCQPNKWQKNLSQQPAALSPTYSLYQEFWQSFVDFCGKETTLKDIHAKADSWISAFSVRPGFGINLNARKKHRNMECHLWVEHPKAQMALAALLTKRDIIVAALGSQVDFDNMQGRDRFKIFEVRDCDVSDRSQWPAMHSWLKERGEAYVAALAPLVKQLKLD